jgi:hypothetical protein
MFGFTCSGGWLYDSNIRSDEGRLSRLGNAAADDLLRTSDTTIRASHPPEPGSSQTSSRNRLRDGDMASPTTDESPMEAYIGYRSLHLRASTALGGEMKDYPVWLLPGLAMVALVVTSILATIALLTGQSFFVVGPLAWSVLPITEAMRLAMRAGLIAAHRGSRRRRRG